MLLSAALFHLGTISFHSLKMISSTFLLLPLSSQLELHFFFFPLFFAVLSIIVNCTTCRRFPGFYCHSHIFRIPRCKVCTYSTSSVITSNWRRIYLTLAHSVLPDIKCWLCLPFHGFIYGPPPESAALQARGKIYPNQLLLPLLLLLLLLLLRILFPSAYIVIFNVMLQRLLIPDVFVGCHLVASCSPVYVGWLDGARGRGLGLKQ